MAGVAGAEGAVAAVAVLERDDDGVAAWGCELLGAWQRRRQKSRDPVPEEFCRVLQGTREVGGEGATDGVGVGVAFEPGGDAGGEGGDVAFGEGERGCVAAEVGEERGGCLV